VEYSELSRLTSFPRTRSRRRRTRASWMPDPSHARAWHSHSRRAPPSPLPGEAVQREAAVLHAALVARLTPLPVSVSAGEAASGSSGGSSAVPAAPGWWLGEGSPQRESPGSASPAPKEEACPDSRLAVCASLCGARAGAGFETPSTPAGCAGGCGAGAPSQAGNEREGRAHGSKSTFLGLLFENSSAPSHRPLPPAWPRLSAAAA